VPGTPISEQQGAPLVDFLVQDIEKVWRTLAEQGVQFLKEPHDTPWGGRIALFADPAGNTLQMVQVDWPKYFAACAT
jgi:predicted enzyme related to lactoylglutathione lyase